MSEPIGVDAVGGERAPFSVVCLASSEWDATLPTNRQQITRRLAERGHEVVFVESGAFLGRHLRRLVSGPDRLSLARQLWSAQPARPRLRIGRALNVVPWGHTYRAANRANCALTALRLRRLADALPRPVVLWLYDPCAAPLVGACGESIAVYDCIDDFAETVRGDPRKRDFVAACDREAARAARLVFVTTRRLLDRHGSRHPGKTHLVRNAGDHLHFAPAADRSLSAPEVEALARPVIGFAGNIVTGKVDFSLLEELARTRPGWTLLLVGPVGEDAVGRLERLTAFDNVRWLGPRPYEDLPRYVAAFDVGLCPYEWNSWMASGFPLKLYEYLAAGKPVVASGNPDLAGMEPDVRVARGPAEFVSAIEAALAEPAERALARAAIAAGNTWETRVERLSALVACELDRLDLAGRSDPGHARRDRPAASVPARRSARC